MGDSINGREQIDLFHSLCTEHLVKKIKIKSHISEINECKL